MVKQYIGKHSLIYEGDYDGEGHHLWPVVIQLRRGQGPLR